MANKFQTEIPLSHIRKQYTGCHQNITAGQNWCFSFCHKNDGDFQHKILFWSHWWLLVRQCNLVQCIPVYEYWRTCHKVIIDSFRIHRFCGLFSRFQSENTYIVPCISVNLSWKPCIYIQTYQLVWGYNNIVLNYSSVFFYLCDALAIWLCMFNLLSIDFSWHFPLSISFIFSIIFRHDFSNRYEIYLFCCMYTRTNMRIDEVRAYFRFKKNINETDCLFNLYFAQEKERYMHIAW